MSDVFAGINRLTRRGNRTGVPEFIVLGAGPDFRSRVLVESKPLPPAFLPGDIDLIQIELSSSRASGTLAPEPRTVSRLRWAIWRNFS